MKLTDEQKIELQKLHYDPCDKRLNIYPEDFKKGIYKEILQFLGIDETYGVTLAVVGVRRSKVVAINTKKERS